MRSTQMCPKCSGKKFAVKAEFRQPHHRGDNITAPFPAITIDVKNQTYGDRITSGQFETWICVACGYTEFYASGKENLDKLAQKYPDQLRIIDAGPPEQGPYR